MKSTGGFDLSLVIDKSGKPVCIGGIEDGTDFTAYTAEREALLYRLPRWRYTPFLVDGKPSAVAITEHIEEKIDAPHIPMPQGRLYDTTVSLRRTGCYGACPAYTVSVRGTGEVTFEGGEYSNLTGRVTYRISPGEVAALIERLRSADLWSMRDTYRSAVTDSSTYVLSVKVGSRHKTIVDYVGRRSGMPEEVTDMENAVDATTHSDDLIYLTPAGLQLLDQAGFVYKGPRGAELLVRTIFEEEGVADETIMGLLDRGAPVSGGHWPDMRWDRYEGSGTLSALDAALIAGRDAVAMRLIGMGALDGAKADPARLNTAFRNAISGGRIELVKAIWGYEADVRPSLSFDYRFYHGDQEQLPAALPVTLLLLRDGATNDKWQDFDIARFLVGLGCDINAATPEGLTLLHAAADANNADYVRWLIAHGAKIDAVDKDGDSPLLKAYDEDVILILLEAGANPSIQPDGFDSFFYSIQAYERPRVIEWLRAHGYEERLKANTSEALAA